ncbi:uncharacterized protein [Ptychodera flava]
MDYTQAYLDYLATKNPARVKFMDESGVKIQTGQRVYGHSQRGVKTYEIGRYLTGANNTVNLLVGLDGVKYCSVIDGPSNGNEFIRYFTEATTAFTDDGEAALNPGDTVVVDNAPIHHHEPGDHVRNLLDDIGVEIVFLPTYSPDFNPVENCFNKMKSLLKKDYYRELLHDNIAVAVYNAVRMITPNDTSDYFAATGYLQVPRQ